MWFRNAWKWSQRKVDYKRPKAEAIDLLRPTNPRLMPDDSSFSDSFENLLLGPNFEPVKIDQIQEDTLEADLPQPEEEKENENLVEDIGEPVLKREHFCDQDIFIGDKLYDMVLSSVPEVSLD